MRRPGGLMLGALGALAAAGAHAQPADPIGALLQGKAAPGRPVFLEETGRSPDASPGPADLAYDSRIRASAEAARGFAGPLEGGWTLSAGRRELYAFELADDAGVVEGAWRDLRRPGALDASGLVERIERNGADVVLRFGPAVARLRAAGDGRWAGELMEAGRAEPAVLSRRD